MEENLLSTLSGLSASKLSQATASASNVLSGKTFYAGNKDIKTGTMTNRGAWSTSVAAGSSVTIPVGYHNGSGKVTANRENKKEWIYYCGLATSATYLVVGNSSWLSSYSRSTVRFSKSGNVRINMYCSTTGEYYSVSVTYNGSTLLSTSGHDGDKSYNGVIYVTAGSSINISMGGGYVCYLFMSIHEE